MHVTRFFWLHLGYMLSTLEATVGSLNYDILTPKIRLQCMAFNPLHRNKIVCKSFTEFKLAENNLNFVKQFKYLGHIIDNSMSVTLNWLGVY